MSGRFIMALGRWDGRHLWCGCILWDTEEMGPCPAMVTEYVRLAREGRHTEAWEAMQDQLDYLTHKKENGKDADE